MNLNLKDKNALICGATGGIGKASALALAEEGVNVTLVARNEDKLKKVLEELDHNQGQNHGYLVADFSEPASLKEKVEEATKTKAYHILLNNTGGPPGGKISEAKTEEFEAAFTQHLICNHILVQALLPGMKERGYGRVINVISTSVKQPLDGLGVSNTIRGAVANWSKTMANELGEFGITVNNILPGATATGRLTDIIKNKANKTGKTEEEVTQAMQSAVPAKRFGQPEELANAVTFLASEAASYINGINVPVDGGRTKSL
ncbi:SDR family oxidoreductase [Mesonia mobilis]|uniref:SDR family oxidoreductase n=1 Tax=Mesonia mobilis TaxID=369791 RepID=UPI0024BA77E7|nr:SDR family oxidoreductase [Mesonia mobilis]